jgi:hypothetical protein
MSITAANAVLTLSIPPLFPVPQQIQGFAADDVFDIPQIKSVEALMGVDGVLSFGFVYVAITWEIILQADSKSNAIFDTWWTSNVAAQDNYAAFGLIKLPGISTKFTLTNGGLTGYKPAPGAKKLLQPRRYELMFQSIAPAPN